MKKALSVFLVFLFVVSLAAPAACAAGHSEKDPLVYIVGRQETYLDVNAEPMEYAIHSHGDDLTNAVKKAMPSFLKAVVTQNWDPYCDTLVDVMREMYADYAPDENGVVRNGSDVPLHYIPGTLTETDQIDSVYSYEFFYDFRDDPWDVADEINAYIQEVKEVTGRDKVNVLSRCSGTAFAMAYLVKYARQNQYADISSFVIYDGTLEGFSFPTDFFTGHLAFDADAVERYADEQLEENLLGEFLKLTVATFNRTYGLKLGMLAVKDVYDKIHAKAFPRVLRVSYATSFGYWTMIKADRFEEAKAYVFGGVEAQYATIISRIDRYHDEVMVKNREMLLEMREKGVRLAVVCKYGSQQIPITSDNRALSDNTVDLVSQSFGATCSPINGTLPQSVIDSTDPAYISPDRQVNAATCLLPEVTWFVKDVPHYDFPDGVSALLVAICRYDGQMTVDSDPAYPRYLKWEAETDRVVPLTAENAGTTKRESLIVRFFRFVALLFRQIKKMIVREDKR